MMGCRWRIRRFWHTKMEAQNYRGMEDVPMPWMAGCMGPEYYPAEQEYEGMMEKMREMMEMAWRRTFWRWYHGCGPMFPFMGGESGGKDNPKGQPLEDRQKEA
ncbi:hypothetical protein [Thermococcus thermotolerans]|uniref:hypothetical protein n=1 Tax=Thermococcus thermotolerans TaxID=2969672 RepID=UPI002158404E|nr:hypothetical protein [Thermococcus thermotolerans]